jgi:hypothetical protein
MGAAPARASAPPPAPPSADGVEGVRAVRAQALASAVEARRTQAEDAARLQRSTAAAAAAERALAAMRSVHAEAQPPVPSVGQALQLPAAAAGCEPLSEVLAAARATGEKDGRAGPMTKPLAPGCEQIDTVDAGGRALPHVDSVLARTEPERC